MTTEIVLCIIGLALLATGALSFWIGYIFGWNDRGIHNRARRAGIEHAERQHDRWRTTLLDDHHREAAADRHWDNILREWASEDTRQSHIMELPAGAWPAEDIPRPMLDSTGPQDVIA